MKTTRRCSPSPRAPKKSKDALESVTLLPSLSNDEHRAEGTVSHGNAIFESQFAYICGAIMNAARTKAIQMTSDAVFIWKSTPKPMQCLFCVILCFVLFLCWSQFVWTGVVREYFLLELSGSEQWMHIKRHFYLSHDIFEHTALSTTNYFASSSIAIVGMIRNHDHTLEALLKQLDNLSCFFALSAVLIYESNSDDETPRLLQEWSRRGNVENALCLQFADDDEHRSIGSNGDGSNSETPRSTQMIKTLLDPEHDPGEGFHGGSRLDKYSRYRNYMLNEVMALNIDFDFLAPIDLDVYALDIPQILDQLEKAHRGNVSVMCVNGVGRSGFMFDSLATVAVYHEKGKSEKEKDHWPHWSRNQEEWEMHHEKGEDGHRFEWFYYLDEVHRSNIVYRNNFTEVMSCFGGMAFYNFGDITRTECRYLTSAEAVTTFPAVTEFYYTNLEKGDVGICEHIPFNYCLYAHHLKLVIARNAYLYYGMFHNR